MGKYMRLCEDQINYIALLIRSELAAAMQNMHDGEQIIFEDKD